MERALSLFIYRHLSPELERVTERLFEEGVNIQVLDSLDEEFLKEQDPPIALLVSEQSPELKEILTEMSNWWPVITANSWKDINQKGILSLPNNISAAEAKDLIINFSFDWWAKKRSAKKLKVKALDLVRPKNLHNFSIEDYFSNEKEKTFIRSALEGKPVRFINFLKRGFLVANKVFEEQPMQDTLNASLCNFCFSLAYLSHPVGGDSIFDLAGETKGLALASRLKDTALMVSIKVKNSEVVDNLRKISNFLEDPSTELPYIAQATVITHEFLQRAFSSGRLRPNGAYIFLKTIEMLENFNQELLEQFSSFVVSILSEKVSKVLISPRGLSKEQIKRIFHIVNEPPREDELVVGLNQLQEGVCLARPIVSWDGQKLVIENTILNREIIKKLWSLAALVPVLDPVIKRGPKEPN